MVLILSGPLSFLFLPSSIFFLFNFIIQCCIDWYLRLIIFLSNFYIVISISKKFLRLGWCLIS
jgi:hypothetical protein